MRTALVIPVLNAGTDAERIVTALEHQTLEFAEILVLDSQSTDNGLEAFRRLGARIVEVPRSSFDHGGTRNMAFSLTDADVYVFLTQDAIPATTDAIERLVAPLISDGRVGAAYGRQLPRPNAGSFEAHARLYNYPLESSCRTLGDLSTLGIRAAFCSNSFAAWRATAMKEVGGFPQGTIFGEDSLAAARLLERGWKMLYVSGATVEHSHEYTLRAEFSRYFDHGVSHSINPWFLELVSEPSKEGLRFVASELRYARARGLRMALARVLFRNGVRWLGYRTGRHFRLVPRSLRQRIGMNKRFWRRDAIGEVAG